ncbi:MAG TPA: hypothetical protein VF847_06555 [Candidatus Deferrimicrobiaceae bacterium]
MGKRRGICAGLVFGALACSLVAILPSCTEDSTQSPPPGTVLSGIAIDDSADADTPIDGPSDIGGYRDYSDAVFVREPYAYVAAYEYGLAIVDIRDPVRPVLAGQFDGFRVYGAWVTEDHRHAYVADSLRGLVILDLSDPARPVRVRTLQSAGPTGTEYDLLFLGSVAGFRRDGREYLFAGMSTSAVILDITDRENPAFVYGTSALGAHGSIKIRPPYAVLAGGIVSILDIDNVLAPTLHAAVDVPAAGADLWTDTMTLAVSGGGGISFYDLRNPMLPEFLRTFGEQEFGTPLPTSQGLMISGNYVHAALGERGMVTIERTGPNPAGFRLVRITPMPDLDPADALTPYAMNVWVSGGIAYVACKEDGLRIVTVEP